MWNPSVLHSQYSFPNIEWNYFWNAFDLTNIFQNDAYMQQFRSLLIRFCTSHAPEFEVFESESWTVLIQLRLPT